jgi:hypothetical protein
MTDIYNNVINDVASYIDGIKDIIDNTDPNMDTLISTDLARSAVNADCNSIIRKYQDVKTLLTDQIVPYYNELLIKDQNLSDLYNMYLDQNQGLDLNIKSFYGDSLTNNRKTFYESIALERIVNWNTFFMYLYFTLLFSFVLGIIFSPHRLPRYQSITICIILFLYPFLVDPLWQMIYNFFGRVYNLYPKNVYNKL